MNNQIIIRRAMSLLGRKTSKVKRVSSRRNGKLGGRPAHKKCGV